jgi:hypothetical protein
MIESFELCRYIEIHHRITHQSKITWQGARGLYRHDGNKLKVAYLLLLTWYYNYVSLNIIIIVMAFYIHCLLETTPSI